MTSYQLRHDIVEAYRELLVGTVDPSKVSRSADTWQALSDSCSRLHQRRLLSPEDQQLICSIAENVKILMNAAIVLDTKREDDLEQLSRDFTRLLAGERYKGVSLDICRSRKRDWRPPSPAPSNPNSSPRASPLSALPSDPPTPLEELPPTLNKTSDPIRQWFLAHLSNPYPTPTEKQSLSELTGIARNKIDSDMTNWRRRAGWTEIKDRWAGKDRQAMKVLMEKVEAGKEKRKPVMEAVGKMKAYLRREEEERVGDWVHELTSMVGTSSTVSTSISADRRAKKPRTSDSSVDSEASLHRPITPPNPLHRTPSSSASFVGAAHKPYTSPLATFPVPMHKESPAHSLRSASSSSIDSAISVPYPEITLFNTYAHAPFLPPLAAPVAGAKRKDASPAQGPVANRPRLVTAISFQDQVPRWTGNCPFTSTPLMLDPSPVIAPPLSAHGVPLAVPSQENAVWNTQGHLPQLEHMAAGGSSGFTMPTNWEFTPDASWSRAYPPQ